MPQTRRARAEGLAICHLHRIEPRHAGVMPEIASFDALSDRLDALEERLALFHDRFRDAEKSDILRRFRARQAEIRQRIAAARARGDVWDMIGLEFMREFDALAAEVSATIVSGGGDERDGPEDKESS